MSTLYCICHVREANGLSQLAKCVHRRHEHDSKAFGYAGKAVESGDGGWLRFLSERRQRGRFHMQNRKAGLLGLAAAALALAGCAKTPDQAVVRQKGDDSLAQYQEADTPGEDDAGGSAEQAAADENQGTASDEDTDSTNALAQRLQVPERYTASDSEGIYKLNCDAQVIVPDAERVPVWKVSQREFSQELIDRVTEAFFGDRPVYNGDTYYVETKEEVLEKLERYKAWQAEGSHPYGPYVLEEDLQYYSAEDLAEMSTLQDYIDACEQDYADAPEEPDRSEVAPALGASWWIGGENGEKQYNQDGDDKWFSGVVELDDGTFYDYRLGSRQDMPMEIKIQRRKGRSDAVSWYTQDLNGTNPNQLPAPEELIRMTGISPEEAQAMTDVYMEKLGLSEEFSAKAVNLSVGWRLIDEAADGGSGSEFESAGWQVDYTRDVGGFPITDEENFGGALQSIDDTTTVPWCYERVEFTVNAEGLQNVTILNLYDVGEQQVENVEMLSFPEVAGIFEQMLRIKSANMEYSTLSEYEINRVQLGYMRIYDPGTDSWSGLLVPVWDFFGRHTDEYDYEGETGSSAVERPQNSFLTVNAVDGTVIDRSLGY